MKITHAEFITGAVSLSGYPSLGKPEFAFFGRSNAGKSSLINMLVNRKHLVRTGSRPGMTRQINFFLINNTFCLVDLPGYGYAQRSAAEQSAFDLMLAEYCQHRTELKAVFYLMDIRRNPGEAELRTVTWFRELGLQLYIIATKADKLGTTHVQRAVAKLAQFLKVPAESVIASSATDHTGRDRILSCVSSKDSHAAENFS